MLIYVITPNTYIRIASKIKNASLNLVIRLPINF
jgi:hypothetical protein